MAGGRSKKDGKVLKPCVGSRFTWGSMHSALKDVSRLAGVKSELWSRVLGVIVGSEAQDDEWAALLEELRGAVTAAMEASTSVRITAEKCGVELESACEAKYGPVSEKKVNNLMAFDLRNIPGPYEAPWEAFAGAGERASNTDGPARLLVSPGLQTTKEAYISAAERVSVAEAAFRDKTGVCLRVAVAGSSQIESSSIRDQAWAESRSWAFFWHCCNMVGGPVHASQPCSACDCRLPFVVAGIRATACKQKDLGTQYLESVNGTIAPRHTKRSDYPLTHSL